MLTLLAIGRAKKRDKPYKLADGGGLHLLVEPSGSKLWRFRYQFDRKEKMISFGSFPEISIAAARAKRESARKLLAEGTDPSQQKKLDKIAAETAANNTFGLIAEEHLDNLRKAGRAEATIIKARWFLRDLASPLTKRPIAGNNARRNSDHRQKDRSQWPAGDG